MIKTLIPYGHQLITDADIAAVVNVLRSDCLTQGPTLASFEKAVASKVRANYGVAVNSATSALHIACLAMGLGPGDYLWTSPLTFVASANCGRYCGAEVDFVDIDPSTGLISLDALAQKLEKAEKEGKLPKVLIPVHLCGASCDMIAIAALAERYGFAVLEDASHAIGGYYFNDPVGSCKYSQITVFSFHPVKIITTGEGGLATTNNIELMQRMVDLRSHGVIKDPQRFEYPDAGPWSYEQHHLGFNYKMNDIQAALGLSQLQRLEEIVIERNRLLERYRGLLIDLPVDLLKVPVDVLSSVHLAVIRLSDSDPMLHHRVFKGLREVGIGVQLHYTPVYLQPYYRKLGFQRGHCPEAEDYSTNAISIPLFESLRDDQQLYIVAKLQQLLNIMKSPV